MPIADRVKISVDREVHKRLKLRAVAAGEKLETVSDRMITAGLDAKPVTAKKVAKV